jgi:benzoate membrane transport protein
MIGVLTNAFETAFSGKFKLGAFFALIIAASGITIFKIGAPFWALTIGVIISLIMEKEDFESNKKK